MKLFILICSLLLVNGFVFTRDDIRCFDNDDFTNCSPLLETIECSFKDKNLICKTNSDSLQIMEYEIHCSSNTNRCVINVKTYENLLLFGFFILFSFFLGSLCL